MQGHWYWCRTYYIHGLLVQNYNQANMNLYKQIMKLVNVIPTLCMEGQPNFKKKFSLQFAMQ